MTREDWKSWVNENRKTLIDKSYQYRYCPWDYAQKPFHVIDHIYYVGSQYVASYLIDTGEGLILIDSGFYQTVYQLVENICQLGFKPENIKKLLLTHAHFDHCGGARAIQELSGCEIYLSREDLWLLTERRELIYFQDEVPKFTVDRLYSDTEPICLGSAVIYTKHTPGHTPGTTSMFYKLRHNGQDLVGATHGGIGLNGISRMELEENRLPVRLQKDYIDSLHKLLNVHVDVTLPSHNKHCPYFLAAAEKDCRPESFIDSRNWANMIKNMLAQAEDMAASGI